MIAGGGEAKGAKIVDILLATGDEDRPVGPLYQFGQSIGHRPLWPLPDPTAFAIWSPLAKFLGLIADGLIERRALLIDVIVGRHDRLRRRPLTEIRCVSIRPEPIECGLVIAARGKPNEFDGVTALALAVTVPTILFGAYEQTPVLGEVLFIAGALAALLAEQPARNLNDWN